MSQLSRYPGIKKINLVLRNEDIAGICIEMLFISAMFLLVAREVRRRKLW